MSQAKCAHCGRKVPLEQARHVGSEALCPPCAEATGAEPPVANRAAPAVVSPGAETSVSLSATQPCAHCQQQTLVPDLVPLAGVAVCPKCAHFFRHRPFPAWVKIAAVAVAALAVFVFVRNQRFIDGHLQFKRAERLVAAGDNEGASAQIEAALVSVPESKKIRQNADFMRAVMLVDHDQPAEAAEALRMYRRQYGPHKTVDVWLARAESLAAFKAKDWDKFLAKSKDYMSLRPRDANAVGEHAFALAWKYADSRDPRYKQEAEAEIERATRMAGPEDQELLDGLRRTRDNLGKMQNGLAPGADRASGWKFGPGSDLWSKMPAPIEKPADAKKRGDAKKPAAEKKPELRIKIQDKL